MMNKFLLLTLLLVFSICGFSQSPNQIRQKCQNPYGSNYGIVQITAAGNIVYTPCPTRTSIFNGNVNFSNATVTGLPFTISPLTTKGDIWGYSTTNERIPVGANGEVLTADSTQPLGVKWAAAGGGGVTGSGTANFIPRWSGATALTNTPFSWNGTTYTFQNTALNSTFPFSYTPTSASGVFSVGQNTSSFFSLTQSTGVSSLIGSSQILLNSKAGFTSIGDTDLTNNQTRILVFDSTSTIELNAVSTTRIKNKIAIANTSDCVGQVTLDGGGQFDLAGTTCGALIDASTVILLTGQTTTGILKADSTGNIVSSVGAVDAGATVNYWIIYRY